MVVNSLCLFRKSSHTLATAASEDVSDLHKNVEKSWKELPGPRSLPFVGTLYKYLPGGKTQYPGCLRELLSVPEKGAYLFSLQFSHCRHCCRIMVSLEYLPYYWKLLNHIWQLYTLGVGKFLHMLKFFFFFFIFFHDEKCHYIFTGGTHTLAEVTQYYHCKSYNLN